MRSVLLPAFGTLFSLGASGAQIFCDTKHDPAAVSSAALAVQETERCISQAFILTITRLNSNDLPSNVQNCVSQLQSIIDKCLAAPESALGGTLETDQVLYDIALVDAEDEARVQKKSVRVKRAGRNTSRDKSKTTSPPASKTTSKPVSKTTSKPVSKTTSNPVSNTSSKPVSNTSSKPVSNTTSNPVSNTSSKPVSNTTSNPVSNTTSNPVSNTSSKPVSNTTSNPVSNTTSKPVSNTSSQSKPTSSQTSACPAPGQNNTRIDGKGQTNPQQKRADRTDPGGSRGDPALFDCGKPYDRYYREHKNLEGSAETTWWTYRKKNGWDGSGLLNSHGVPKNSKAYKVLDVMRNNGKFDVIKITGGNVYTRGHPDGPHVHGTRYKDYTGLTGQYLIINGGFFKPNSPDKYAAVGETSPGVTDLRLDAVEPYKAHYERITGVDGEYISSGPNIKTSWKQPKDVSWTYNKQLNGGEVIPGSLSHTSDPNERLAIAYNTNGDKYVFVYTVENRAAHGLNMHGWRNLIKEWLQIWERKDITQMEQVTNLDGGGSIQVVFKGSYRRARPIRIAQGNIGDTIPGKHPENDKEERKVANLIMISPGQLTFPAALPPGEDAVLSENDSDNDADSDPGSPGVGPSNPPPS
ncbi:unnamed protein product [Periconia digitata]|uniref:Phosphodiester glycosidase domain-containing protein n=1 Tax=Periconia digitata TaxID=1303443 RepID=A0A9W4UQ70_9PLEO|nr:unnamed protein product [Periconia digitata]